jgi:hypothetical protein
MTYYEGEIYHEKGGEVLRQTKEDIVHNGPYLHQRTGRRHQIGSVGQLTEFTEGATRQKVDNDFFQVVCIIVSYVFTFYLIEVRYLPKTSLPNSTA